MKPTKKVLDTLRACTLLSGLDEESLIQLAGEAEEERYAPGGEILREGVGAHRLGVLLTGEAQVYKSAGENKLLVSVLGAGSVIGAATLFLKDAVAATGIRAKRNTSVLWVGEEALTELMRADFAFTRSYIEYLTSRIHFLTGRMESIACAGAAERLYGFLVKNAEDGKVVLPAGMNELARALSISRASLYRVMDEFIRSGKLRRDGKTIYIV